mmetsp:Transcript_23977/g.60195  ORF Transcript_23977/g.60195 Transcript_23977/m.60195 type:complete len:256 (-) Transcript_23977:316-1083(-)
MGQRYHAGCQGSPHIPPHLHVRLAGRRRPARPPPPHSRQGGVLHRRVLPRTAGVRKGRQPAVGLRPPRRPGPLPDGRHRQRNRHTLLQRRHACGGRWRAWAIRQVHPVGGGRQGGGPPGHRHLHHVQWRRRRHPSVCRRRGAAHRGGPHRDAPDLPRGGVGAGAQARGFRRLRLRLPAGPQARRQGARQVLLLRPSRRPPSHGWGIGGQRHHLHEGLLLRRPPPDYQHFRLQEAHRHRPSARHTLRGLHLHRIGA